MGLLDRIKDEQIRLQAEEDILDAKYLERKKAINARQKLLLQAAQVVTPDLDLLVDKLGLSL